MVLPQFTFDLMEAYETLGPLALVIGGITIYGVFVFNFYRFLARKDIFTLNLQKHNQSGHPVLRKTFSVISFTIMSLILYPVFVFIWFGVMAGLLFFLSQNQTTENVMLVAMGVVGAIRVCAYYTEALATDIAKVLPFSLLGVMIIDNAIAGFVDSTEHVREFALQWETIAYYLVAVVILEFVLRILSGIVGLFRGGKKAPEQEEQTGGAVVEPRDAQPAPANPASSADMRPSAEPAGTGGNGDGA